MITHKGIFKGPRTRVGLPKNKVLEIGSTYMRLALHAALTNGHPVGVALAPSLADLGTLVGIQGD